MYRRISLLALAFAALITPLYAADIDGVFNGAGEGYTTGFDLTYTVENHSGSVPDGAEMWVKVESNGDLSVIFFLPKDLVDNSYGTHQVGWGSNAPNGKNHGWKDLDGSDDAEIVLKGSGSNKLEFTVDYIDGDNESSAKDFVVTGSNAGGLASGDLDDNDGVTAESSLDWLANTKFTGSGDASRFKDGGTSPETDNPKAYPGKAGTSYGGTSTFVKDSTYKDWIFDIVYEFQVKAGALPTGFDASKASSYMIPVLHASPNKIGKNKVFVTGITPMSGGGVIPEPSTWLMWSLFTGIAFLFGRRRMRQKKQDA